MNHDNTILDDCVVLLKKYASAFPRPNDVDGQPVQPAVRMLALGMDCGIRTIRGVTMLLSDDESNAVLACTLLRPFYELSVRLLWASRADDGWRRLYAYYVEESKKWANESKNVPALASIVQETLRVAQNVMAWTNVNGQPLLQAPNFQQTLIDVETHDTNGGLSSGQGQIGQQLYTAIYRILCRAAHGHIESLTGAEDRMFSRHSRVVALYGAVNLLQAYIHHTSKTPNNDISNMLKEFWPLLQRCRTNQATSTADETTR